jgi:hypothetical protein
MTATFTMPDNAVAVMAVFLEYDDEYPGEDAFEVTESPEEPWTGSGDATWRIEGADPDDFYRLVHVGDNEIIDSDYVEVSYGSTRITLSGAYIATLANGEHTFRAEFTTGYALLPLTVDVPDDPNGNGENGEDENGEAAPTPTPTADSGIPQTGDGSNTAAWLMLLLGSLTARSLFICIYSLIQKVRSYCV